ncbi:hypothetical protein [Mesorhizobium sp.]|uniref:hypothetical protein n=1 Tax=Mesorhizobium sp. TaxID=1871066 RepID=UPI000FE47898|nr:hypothetical protein [Mesorhizobium sp.]RWO22814.1 MAG: hypothetical protein EOS09_19280 [Mesorhizobium sp.]
MPLPWEEFQPQKSERLPWQDYQATTVDPATNQPAGVPAFAPPGVEGYDPQTGEVQQYGQGDSAAMGAADATTFGWGDELASYLGSGLSGVPREQVLREMRGNASKAQFDNPGSYLAGQVGGGLAQALATGGAGAASALARGGGTLGKVALGSAVDGLLYGGAYGSGSADDGDRLAGGAKGAAFGAAVGGAAPFVAAGASKLARKVVSPFAGSPEREAAVLALAQEGVPVTAGQRTGSNALRYAESEIGGSRAAKVMDDQAEAFTDAAMRKAGGAGRATSDNMGRLKDQIGKQFDDISARNSLRVDRGIVDDMNAANLEYSRVLPAEQRKIFGNLGDDIVQKFKAGKGVISGADYQTIRSRLSRMANNNRQSDPEFSQAIRGLRDALDNGMDRSIRPQDAGAWAQARKRYGNLKTLEKAAVGGGEESAMGLISPAQLRVAAASGNRGGYARGDGDFADLAKAGQAVMSKLPNSGTASRLSARSLGMMAPTILGAGYGGASGGDLQSAMAGAAAGYGLQKGAGMALMNPAVQRYLGNQTATGPANRVSEALLAAILRDGGIQALLGSR